MSAPLQPARVTNEPSTLLRYSARFFELSGVAALLGLATAYTTAAFGSHNFLQLLTDRPATAIFAALAGLSFLWTGRGLRRRSRDSAIGAVITFLSPLAVGYVTRGLLSETTFVIATVSCLILWAVWDELE